VGSRDDINTSAFGDDRIRKTHAAGAFFRDRGMLLFLGERLNA
jgi:hypothetical protein